MTALRDVFFLPPLGIARVGGSPTPLEAFEWDTDVSAHGAHRTVIRPAVTFTVLDNGSLRPYVPNVIHFKDGELLRPVAPFFELWARVQRPGADGGTAEETEEPLNLALLRELGIALDAVKYAVTVANRKAERRTQDPACAYVAQVAATAEEYEPRPLLACSPHNPGQEPLVSKERPISLGTFRVIRPIPRRAFGLDLSTLRVRFTPARGHVYGPPRAIEAMASTVPPGELTQPLIGRLHEIVPPENRILSGNTPWTRYVWNAEGQTDPQPADSYDGAHEGTRMSWGVVDDTCDGVIQAQVVCGGRRFTAAARVLAGVPDFAPDRRHFASLAEDLADRDLPDRTVDAATAEAVEQEVADMFQRVFEYVSLMNLDSIRAFTLGDNASMPDRTNYPGLPKVDERMMTRADEGYVDELPDRLPDPLSDAAPTGVPRDELPYTLAARDVHAALTDVDSMVEVLRTKADHIRRLIRPPFGRFWQLETEPGPEPSPEFRDPRVIRDTLQDMRMPPFMRDSDENPLSLSWRQYRLLIDFLDYLQQQEGEPVGAPHQAPSRRMVQRLVARLGSAPDRPDGGRGA